MLNGGNWPATADSSSWSRLEDKLFERALAVFSENTPDRWEKIASQVPGKTWVEVRRHYEDLVHDVSEIDSGRVQLPNYCDDNEEEEGEEEDVGDLVGTRDRVLLVSKGSREKETERRRGVAWTSGRAQAVSNWTGNIWKGRLEEYCKEGSCLQNSGSNG